MSEHFISHNISEEEPQQPTLEELDAYRGREIAEIPVTPERFTRLEIGKDAEIVEHNSHISGPEAGAPNFFFLNPSDGETTLNIEAPHWRSVGTGQQEMVWTGSDVKNKEVFFDVDVKGVGYLKPSAKGYSFDRYDSWFIEDIRGDEGDEGYKVLGLGSRDDFYPEGDSVLETSNRLLEAGLRTEAYLAIGKVRRLPFQGKFLSVPELKRRGVIPNMRGWTPHQAVRLLKCHNRVQEFVEDPKRAPALLKRAVEAFNKEAQFLNSDDVRPVDMESREDQKRFFLTFAERMGSNFAVLMNTGNIHYRAHSANITLGAEICDVGTISKWDAEDDPDFTKMYDGVSRGHIKDMRDFITALKMLRSAARAYGLQVGSGDEWLKAFVAGFEKTADNKAIAAYGNDGNGTRAWISKVGDRTLVRDEVLPGLLKHQIEDWNFE